MNELRLNVRTVTEEDMTTLEQKGLLKRMLPSTEVLSTPENEVVDDFQYKANKNFGAHALLCVGFNRSDINMGYHSENEDWILINEGRQQKPLILVIALHPVDKFQKLVETHQLTSDDIWALEMKFNDSRLSFFTMHGYTPHCEWTTPGPGPANVFYVTEPSELDMHQINMGEYLISIKYD